MLKYFLYVDPSSGSYLIQVIVAAVLGSLFWIKSYWYRIKSFFTGKKMEAPEKTTEKEN
jgi:hypothetical protein